MPEQSVPLASAVSDALMLGRLIATRDAARMALGGLHVGSTPVASDLLALLSWGALPRPALPLFAVRRHRSSVRLNLAFSAAYHLTTG